MIKFRFVELDDNDNIVKVLHETKEYDNRWNNDWGNECYYKIIELSKIYNFTDYDNCPNISIEKFEDGEWRFFDSAVEYWFNL